MGPALLFAKAINEQTPNFSFCIFHCSWQPIYSPTKFLKHWNYLQYQKILCTESFSDQNIITGFQFFKQYRSKQGLLYGFLHFTACSVAFIFNEQSVSRTIPMCPIVLFPIVNHCKFLVIKPSIGIIYVFKSEISSPEAQKAELVVTRWHPLERFHFAFTAYFFIRRHQSFQRELNLIRFQALSQKSELHTYLIKSETSSPKA